VILEEASRVDVSQLSADVTKIGVHLKSIEKRIESKIDQSDPRNLFCDVMTHFLKLGQIHFQQLKNKHDKLNSDCIQLAEYLNQGNDIQMEFFKLLNEFRQLFIKAQETVVQREQQAMKEKEKQKMKERNALPTVITAPEKQQQTVKQLYNKVQAAKKKRRQSQ